MEGIRFFEQPALPGWVYPCTLDEIQAVLDLVPAEDRAGLTAIGLAPSTKKNWSANGRYFRHRRAVLIYSYRADLTIRYDANTREGRLRDWCHRELRFGMRLERQGSRWLGIWEADNLRDFILWHVLLHEVGHHVYFKARHPWHLETRSWQVEEQFAEDYAFRLRRLIRPIA